MTLSRRGVFSFLAMAPAIVRAASLMPVKTILWEPPVFQQPSNHLLTIQEITREAVQRFKQTNAFIEVMRAQYRRDLEFVDGLQWKVGETLRVRLPNDWDLK